MGTGMTKRPITVSDFIAGHGFDLASKRVVAADLDKTLAVSRSPIDGEMAKLIDLLLEERVLAIITGGMYSQLKEQFADRLLQNGRHLERVYLLAGCGADFHRFGGGKWKQVYIEELSAEEKRHISTTIEQTLKGIGYTNPKKIYGKLIDERPTQVTFSALGQDAPQAEKAAWDPTLEKRKYLKGHLEKALPEYKVAIGGGTSLDITKKWIDKAYGIRKLMEIVPCTADEILFIGDALFEDGADYPVATEGVDCIQVEGPDEGKDIMRRIVESPIRKQAGK